jgi:alpha-amylase/alpha-mannosidase (GH57 family)
LSVRSIVIHGHFYQPPREDPWLNEVLAEPSAAPFHDWNQRIERECYRAVVAARLYAPPPDGRITGIVNTLTSISFDFGPTLLEWLEREAPDTYAAVLEADRQSRGRHDGHGNAIAMPYHHTILPLATRRDKVTEVRWGIADFRRRFQRDPAGLWLPETAVDAETLDVLAAEGIAFTILAPHQVVRVPDGGLPGSYRTPSGRSIALFTYDGAISHDVAFGSLLKDAAKWAERLLAAGQGGSRARLVAVATDGETFGHHHRFGEVALAWLLRELEHRRGVRVENFAAFLARHPPQQEVELVAPTSWSCPHGVERWRADCGCRIAPERPTQQRWRAPLREGLDWLAAELHARFEREGAEPLGDVWAARDAYGAVVGSDAVSSGPFAAAPPRARELLELERNALRMFTSCGWFFDDIAGIEAVQILRYAARAIELAGADAPRLEAGLLERLARAESNAPGVGSGREVYVERAKRRVPPPPPPPPPASGAAAPPEDLERELLGAVRSLARDQSPRAISAVLELADRLPGDHREIPFDVQTAFYRIRAAAPPERAAPLTPVARRLGFAEGGGG